jgi:hypothetical protein
MKTLETEQSYQDIVAQLMKAPSLKALMDDLCLGLSSYWFSAQEILKTCGVRLQMPDAADFSLAKNFFSLLFLYSYRRAGITRRRCHLYTATLQCLRGMVTGCDNLLDDEYKPTLVTDIPESGIRFRSVVDIMVSDRVLFTVLANAAEKGEIPPDRLLAATTVSMQTMTRSGLEEAAEEGGVSAILEPGAILESVHHFKTGILFQCPWDIPRAIETVPDAILSPLLEGLYHIGIGCQILDDMVDLPPDILSRKHNYLVSLIHHGTEGEEKARLARAMAPDGQKDAIALDIRQFPEALQKAGKTARRRLTEGLTRIFSEEDQNLVPPAIRFLEKRIGGVLSISGPNP